jgi:hypothetical protein
VLTIAAFRPDLDGRILAGGILAAYVLVIAVPRVIWGINIWPRLGVPAAPTLFFDTRVVTAGLDCRRLGFDPLTYNPCDPAGRPLNYPRVWLLLRWLGINQSHTELLAVVFIVLFLCALFLLLGRISLGEGALVSVALCSPSVMFGIERGNTDLVVFSMMAFAVLAWRRRDSAGEVLSPLLVLLAAILKIFPVLGLPAYLVARRRRASVVALTCIAVMVVYLLLFKSDIESIARGTPQGEYDSYGARILPATIYHALALDRWRGGSVAKQLLAIVPVVIATPWVWVLGRRTRPRPDHGTGGWRRLAFHLGSLLFLGTFLATNSWDYRLVFILLTLPQLFAWITDPAPDPRGALAAITTVFLLVLLWIGALSAPLHTMDELATWASAGLLLALLAASVPGLGEILRPT